MITDQERAFLGLATTETLMKELIARFQTNGMVSEDEFDAVLNFNRARTLVYMLWGLHPLEAMYRSVDSH